ELGPGAGDASNQKERPAVAGRAGRCLQGTRTMRVLVVDDNRDAADTLATLLRLEGHEVRVAYDGPSALAAARDFEPQVALLDFQMPRMHGGDVALHLRRQAGPEGMTIIAASGVDPDEVGLS